MRLVASLILISLVSACNTPSVSNPLPSEPSPEVQGGDCVVDTQDPHVTVTCGEYPPVQVEMRPNSLVRVSEESAGAACPAGGHRIDSGIDDGAGAGEPRDGVLADDEVDATQFICNDEKVVPSCLPPSPAPECPFVQYFVDRVIQPEQRSLEGGFEVTLQGVFPANAEVSNTTVTRSSDALPLTIIGASAFEVSFAAAAGSGRDTVALTISGLEIRALDKKVKGDGSLEIAYDSDITFSYSPPTLTSVSGCPASDGPLAPKDCATAGTVITIVGQNFGPDASAISVAAGGSECSDVTLTSPDTLTCTLSAGANAAEVSVSVSDLTSTNVAHLSYVRPVIESVSAGGAMMRSGATLTLTGSNFSNVTSVSYGPGETPFSCVPNQVTDTEIQCLAEMGGSGSALSFVVSDGSSYSPIFASSLSYAPPAIMGFVDSTGTTISSPQLSAVGGERLFFSAQNVGNRKEYMRVTYGPYDCYDIDFVYDESTQDPEDVVMSCTTSPGEGSYPVQLTVSGQTGSSANDVSFSSAPSISSVVGCADICPTEGHIPITIIGAGFIEGSYAFVGEARCLVDLAQSTQESLVCTLPEGVGSSSVRVFSGGIPSNAVSLTYAPPSITSVSGCQDSGPTTTDCPREGLTTITINGANFGARDASVFIGNNECSKEAHDQLTPHRKLTCVLPPGSGANQAVRVMNGSVSQPFYISYQ